jgi:hypothetical protein
MAVINRLAGYLFLSEPHCASRSLTQVLCSHKGSVPIGQHDTLEQLISKGDVSVDDAVLKFCVIRNPKDWLVTRFHHMTSWHKAGFKSFLKYQIENDTLSRVMFAHAPVCNRILRHETLLPDLKNLLAKFSLKVTELPVIGKTKGRQPWRDYFDEESLGCLRTYMKNIPTYGYSV